MARSEHSNDPGSQPRGRRPFRGIVGLATLVLGFAVQASGYALALDKGGLHFAAGSREALVGVGLAPTGALLVPLLERVAGPWWRNRKLVRVAKYDPEIDSLRAKPVAHILRSYGEELGTARRPGEDDVGYCKRVFKAAAEAI